MHRHLTRRQVARMAPDFKAESITGAIRYYDCQVDDARMVVAVARTAAKHGAHVATRVKVTGFLREGERVVGVTARDREHDQDLEIRARVVVNAAGVFGPLETIAAGDPERWIDTLTINTIGPYRMCRALAAGMVTHGWGRIINYSSAASLHPPGPLVSAYATSKVALNQFTRHLATELAGSGVTANVIHPGDVKTAMWADIRDEAENLGPEGDNYRSWVKWGDETGGDPPAKAADLVLELAADKAAGTTGQFLWIADGLQAPIKSWDPPEDARPW